MEDEDDMTLGDIVAAVITSQEAATNPKPKSQASPSPPANEEEDVELHEPQQEDQLQEGGKKTLIPVVTSKKEKSAPVLRPVAVVGEAGPAGGVDDDAPVAMEEEADPPQTEQEQEQVEMEAKNGVDDKEYGVEGIPADAAPTPAVPKEAVAPAPPEEAAVAHVDDAPASDPEPAPKAVTTTTTTTTITSSISNSSNSSNSSSKSSSSSDNSKKSKAKALTCLCGSHSTVMVEARTWPGINKHGGVGRLTKDNGDGTYNIKYLLGGSEKGVDRCYIQCNAVEAADGAEPVKREVKERDFFEPEVPVPAAAAPTVAAAVAGIGRRPTRGKAAVSAVVAPMDEAEEEEEEGEREEEELEAIPAKKGKVTGSDSSSSSINNKRTLAEASKGKSTVPPRAKAPQPPKQKPSPKQQQQQQQQQQQHQHRQRKLEQQKHGKQGKGEECEEDEAEEVDENELPPSSRDCTFPGSVDNLASPCKRASTSPRPTTTATTISQKHGNRRDTDMQSKKVGLWEEAAPSTQYSPPQPSSEDVRLQAFKTKLSQAVIEKGGGEDQISLEDLRGVVEEQQEQQGEEEGGLGFSVEEVAMFLKRLEADNHLMVVDQTVYIV